MQSSVFGSLATADLEAAHHLEEVLDKRDTDLNEQHARVSAKGRPMATMKEFSAFTIVDPRTYISAVDLTPKWASVMKIHISREILEVFTKSHYIMN